MAKPTRSNRSILNNPFARNNQLRGMVFQMGVTAWGISAAYRRIKRLKWWYGTWIVAIAMLFIFFTFFMSTITMIVTFKTTTIITSLMILTITWCISFVVPRVIYKIYRASASVITSAIF